MSPDTLTFKLGKWVTFWIFLSATRGLLEWLEDSQEGSLIVQIGAGIIVGIIVGLASWPIMKDKR
jgi:hypothetical protein